MSLKPGMQMSFLLLMYQSLQRDRAVNRGSIVFQNFTLLSNHFYIISAITITLEYIHIEQKYALREAEKLLY